MISIITPTIRKAGLDIVAKSIQKQTMEDFEWLIGSPFDPEIPWATWIQDDFQAGFWTLNRIYNKLLQQAKGDIIVTWQDYIYALPSGLESFLTSLSDMGVQSIISGVGDQYAKVDAFGKPYEKNWNDPRKTTKYGTFYECNWNDAEFNWCAFWKQAFVDVGGFDEGLDFLGYGGDQLQFAERLRDLDYSFYLDQTNESYTLRHTRDDHGGQENWDKNHVLFNGKYQERKKQLLDTGNWPSLVDFGRQVLLEDK